LGKPYGIKLRCFWEHLREQLGNLANFKGTHLGTLWEHVGKHIGNKGKKKIKNPSPPSPSKEKNKAHHGCMLSLLIDCMELLFPKLFITIFGMG
jgi:hypothetical protein